MKTEHLREIAHRCNHLKERILDELALEFYFHVPRVDHHLYGQRTPFGEAVSTKFAAASHEIEQAAKCLALQPTASVFHLMRAMELAVRRLARRLNMTLTPETTWRQLTGNMDAQIKGMPGQTPKQKQTKNAWEGARVNLHQVGSVLRNNTMHPAAVYSQAEGRDIFAAVRVSMTSLCRL